MSKQSLQESWDAALHAERWSRATARPNDEILVKSYDASELFAPRKNSILRIAANGLLLLTNDQYGPQVKRDEAKTAKRAELEKAFGSFINIADHSIRWQAGLNPYGWENLPMFVQLCRNHDYDALTEDAAVTFNVARRTASIETYQGDSYLIRQVDESLDGKSKELATLVDVRLSDSPDLMLSGLPPLMAIAHTEKAISALRAVEIAPLVESQLGAASNIYTKSQPLI